MTRAEILPFADEHLDGAAALLRARHARHLAAQPQLARVTDFRRQVEQESGAEGSSGAVALEGDRLVGYLIGRRLEDPIGPYVRVELAGHAVTEPELVRDLYALAAGRWVEEGLARQHVFVPVLPGLVKPWFRLSFGASAALAVRETAAPPEADSGVSIRLSTPDDLEASAAFDRLLQLHLASPPSLNGFTVAGQQYFVNDWRDTWDEPQYTHFVAERNGRIVGQVLLYQRPTGDLRIPEHSIDLANAATEPAVRGSGVGLALTAHVLAWAHQHGYRTMTTDWRMTNLLASRFWPRRGWRETFLRLYRSIP